MKQKQNKIDKMRRQLRENKSKIGSLNQNIGKLQNDCLILKNMYAMVALDTAKLRQVLVDGNSFMADNSMMINTDIPMDQTLGPSNLDTIILSP